jgi:DNA-binding transcriptional ArsR family regulator
LHPFLHTLKPMLNQSPTLDRVFHALSDPTRRELVERLSLGPASVSELAAPLPISLAAVVQHVQILELSGVVATSKIGRVRTCRIADGGLDPVTAWVEQRKSIWESRFDRLGDHLDQQSTEQEHDDE